MTMLSGKKDWSLQYRGFARGHPPHYWPGSTELDFPERTRGGTFIRDMTEDINLPQPISIYTNFVKHIILFQCKSNGNDVDDVN